MHRLSYSSDYFLSLFCVWVEVVVRPPARLRLAMNRFLKYMLTKIIRHGTLKISAGPTCSFTGGDGSGTPKALANPRRLVVCI